ncbi:MAG: hypothetical protein WB390_03125, partial [Pseudolabrys sp.]
PAGHERAGGWHRTTSETSQLRVSHGTSQSFLPPVEGQALHIKSAFRGLKIKNMRPDGPFN